MAENLVALLRESRERHAQRALFGERVGGGWRWTTYAEFEQGVAAYTRQLREQGVCAGPRVVIAGDWSLRAAQQAHAVCHCNASFVPLSERSELATWRFVLRHAEPRLVLADERADRLLLEALRREQGQRWRIVELRDGALREPTPGGTDPEPEQAASLCYRRGPSGLFAANVWTHLELCRRAAPLQNTSHSLPRALADALLLRAIFRCAADPGATSAPGATGSSELGVEVGRHGARGRRLRLRLFQPDPQPAQQPRQRACPATSRPARRQLRPCPLRALLGHAQDREITRR